MGVYVWVTCDPLYLPTSLRGVNVWGYARFCYIYLRGNLGVNILDYAQPRQFSSLRGGCCKQPTRQSIPIGAEPPQKSVAKQF